VALSRGYINHLTSQPSSVAPRPSICGRNFRKSLFQEAVGATFSNRNARRLVPISSTEKSRARFSARPLKCSQATGSVSRVRESGGIAHRDNHAGKRIFAPQDIDASGHVADDNWKAASHGFQWSNRKSLMP
jgi:hypothetical protein